VWGEALATVVWGEALATVVPEVLTADLATREQRVQQVGRVILGGLMERVALPVGTCTVHCSRDALLDTAPRLLVVCGRHAGRGVARCGGGAWGQGRSRRG